MRSNAEQLRRADVRVISCVLSSASATGEAVPTLREVLAILVGPLSVGSLATTSRSATGTWGRRRSLRLTVTSPGRRGGMSADDAERSPLLAGLRRCGLGDVSDLQVDGWLRDTDGAPRPVQVIAGDPDAPGGGRRGAPGLPVADHRWTASD